MYSTVLFFVLNVTASLQCLPPYLIYTLMHFTKQLYIDVGGTLRKTGKLIAAFSISV